MYYVLWFKDGELIHEEELAAPFILMGPPQGFTVVSDFTVMMSYLTIANATLDNSGNYTCAATCGARGVEFGMITANLQCTTEVFVYGKYQIHLMHSISLANFLTTQHSDLSLYISHTLHCSHPLVNYLF